MAPNFAMGSRFGAEGARSTFIMSNVVPQFQSLNNGQWGDLEEWIAGRKPPNATAQNFIRGWADEFDEVWVVVGPLFEEDRDSLEAGVSVPSGFFCIVVDEQANGQPRALAFIMPHEDEDVNELTQFLTTVDEVESRAGLDFFHTLPNSIETAMEATGATQLWPLPVAPN
jgi:endonuclease G